MLGRNYIAPTLRESILCMIGVGFWLGITIAFIGFRPEHGIIALAILGLFYTCPTTRRLCVALIPFMIFGASYDWMNLLPNYEVNPVDTIGLYETEKVLFGIPGADGVTLTPNEYFALHTSGFLDFICGLFYLCWVPVPMLFGVYLFMKQKDKTYIHFSLVFLLANLIGFAIYYIHPAAPPWYISEYGSDVIIGTHGSVAGLGAFDQMVGINIFETIYARNSNVFAAVPSLHSAYTFIAFLYAMKGNCRLWLKIFLGVVTVGIWFTAVYTSHHYLIDVIGGILVALLAYMLMEKVLMRFGGFRGFVNRYIGYIANPGKSVADS